MLRPLAVSKEEAILQLSHQPVFQSINAYIKYKNGYSATEMDRLVRNLTPPTQTACRLKCKRMDLR